MRELLKIGPVAERAGVSRGTIRESLEIAAGLDECLPGGRLIATDR